MVNVHSPQAGPDCDRADGQGRPENHLLGLQGLCAHQGGEEPGEISLKFEVESMTKCELIYFQVHYDSSTEPNFEAMGEDNVIANMTCVCIVGIEVPSSLY